MKILRSILVALAIVAATATADERASLILPLKTGTTWTYAGTVQWTPENSTEVREKRIRWQTSVERSTTKDARTAAIVRGFPFELTWYEPGRQPGYSVIVEDAKGIEIARCENRAEAEELMKQALAGESVGDEILRVPVKVGDCLGDEERKDKRYCWHVEEAISGKRGKGWRLAHRTNPDHQILDVVPGVGITRYVFEHHGTVSSVDIELQ